LQSASGQTRVKLAERLAALSPEEQATVMQAMQHLRRVFSSAQSTEESSSENSES
jgi:hypothetical protein